MALCDYQRTQVCMTGALGGPLAVAPQAAAPRAPLKHVQLAAQL